MSSAATATRSAACPGPSSATSRVGSPRRCCPGPGRPTSRRRRTEPSSTSRTGTSIPTTPARRLVVHGPLLGLGRRRWDERQLRARQLVAGEAGTDRRDERRLHLAERDLERIHRHPEGPLEQGGREAEGHVVDLQVVVPHGDPHGHVQPCGRQVVERRLAPHLDHVALLGDRFVPHRVDVGVGHGHVLGRGLLDRSRLGAHFLLAVRSDVLHPGLVDDQAEADVAGARLEGDPREASAYLVEHLVDLVPTATRPAHVVRGHRRGLATDGEHAGIVARPHRIEQTDGWAVALIDLFGPIPSCHVFSLVQ